MAAAAAAAQKEANIALLRKKLKWAALARNGALAPMFATRKIVELNTEKDFNCLFLQTRAGTRMSITPTDLGK